MGPRNTYWPRKINCSWRYQGRAGRQICDRFATLLEKKATGSMRQLLERFDPADAAIAEDYLWLARYLELVEADIELQFNWSNRG